MEQMVTGWAWFSRATQAQAQAQSEKHNNSYFTLGLDAELCTKQSTTAGTQFSIMLAFALQQVKMKLTAQPQAQEYSPHVVMFG